MLIERTLDDPYILISNIRLTYTKQMMEKQ